MVTSQTLWDLANAIAHRLERVNVALLAHPLRQELIAAASISDRPIAGHAVLSNTSLHSTITQNGQALWQVAERHAAMLYRRSMSGSEIDPNDPAVESALQQCGTGQLLPIALRRDMEHALGISLASVHIHTDAVAAQAARALNAEAFTVGNDIFFAEGMFTFDTRSGRKLLAHELAHVAQTLRGDTEPASSGLRVSQPGEPMI